MNRINTKSIIFSSKTLFLLVFSLLVIPTNVFATAGYVDNPMPYISSISPNSSNLNYGGNIVVAITGNGFIPSSIARVNGADRPTTFIDYSHILIKINPNDTYNTDGFYINVFNGFPGGGYSNAKLFTINNKTSILNTNNNYNQSSTITKNTTGNYNTNNTTSNTYSNTNQTENTTSSDDNTEKKSSNLVSTAIFGSNGFLPSGLMQWILFAILILLIVILVRKISGAEAKYNKAPMKTP